MIKTRAGHNPQELRPLEEAEGLIAGFSSARSDTNFARGFDFVSAERTSGVKGK